MARPKKCRKISNPPIMKGFIPHGIPLCDLETIQLTFEGFETIKLLNYEFLSQEQAAIQMNVSRPTLSRIYNKAISVIAKAFIECKAIEIEGGEYQFEQEWYRCKKCHKLIQGIDNHTKCVNCNMFSKDELINLNLK